MQLRSWLVERVVHFMTRPLGHYERRGFNDLDALVRSLKKGDVLLVEGNQRISAVIRYVTQSSWSHVALYVGDELLRRGEHLRTEAQAIFGDDAQHMLIEALLEGVVASPVSKYRHLNVRVCRARDLKTHDRAKILDDAVRSLGWRYDLRNILDLLRYLLPVPLLPTRFRRAVSNAGSGIPTAAICSSHIGRLFEDVGFPIAPLVERRETDAQGSAPRRGVRAWLAREKSSHDAILFRRRHPSLLTPRDFDLSPYFEIVKSGPGSEGGFDYARIRWLQEDASPAKPGAQSRQGEALPFNRSEGER